MNGLTVIPAVLFIAACIVAAAQVAGTEMRQTRRREEDRRWAHAVDAERRRREALR